MARRINLRQVEAFKAVIEHGTVSRAAEMMNVSQPAMSKLIAHLEEDTGLRLFDRLKGRLAPTRRGMRLYEEIDRIFAGVRQVRLQPLRPETCNLNGLIIDFDALIRRALGETISVRSNLHPGLWPCNVDPAQFEAAILNLIVNARDAMPTGGTLSITTQNVTIAPSDPMTDDDVAPGPFVTVTVADTGTGMAPDVLARAFEPFYTTKEIGKGSGLGLSQLYGFARQSGGTVKIASEIGKGTAVSVYLPKATRLVAQPEPDKPTTKPKGSETVLVVEDDPDVLDIAVATLTDLGYRILVAYDGVEAMAILERDEPIDLIFTDIVMPYGISGIQLARQARKLRQDIKILLTSGYTMQTLSADYGAEKEFTVIGKPYRQAELAEHVRRALRGRDATPD